MEAVEGGASAETSEILSHLCRKRSQGWPKGIQSVKVRSWACICGQIQGAM